MAESQESLGSHLRMHSTLEFSAVYATRRSIRSGDLIVCVRRNDLGHSRLGLSVSVRVGNAVVRNRVKRILREVFRRNLDSIPGDFDLVLIPKGARALSSYSSAASIFQGLMRRLRQKVN